MKDILPLPVLNFSRKDDAPEPITYNGTTDDGALLIPTLNFARKPCPCDRDDDYLPVPSL